METKKYQNALGLIIFNMYLNPQQKDENTLFYRLLTERVKQSNGSDTLHNLLIQKLHNDSVQLLHIDLDEYSPDEAVMVMDILTCENEREILEAINKHSEKLTLKEADEIEKDTQSFFKYMNATPQRKKQKITDLAEEYVNANPIKEIK